ncbi:YidC/Oxa1 family membrane protein insertase [Jiangella sp. DSM 45060]|uniref:YidC/Oxa1 family membrane protein insertase n=1 Tax=Jiangella sp. DSM 45060 TaxID=1798224 RepID=UPI00087AF56E|nr:YidC/Oxa1 family membrane protein insertase [Jiangella sp. DSM 45060]SDS74568.1 YidC/Oxa1 family membrane protein insertase [Jiangella sp. DSM 45060]
MLSVLDTPAQGVSVLVLGLSSAVEPLAGDAATGLAILLVVVLVRLALLPLSLRAARAGRARLALRPAESRLRERFRRDPVRLRRELTALHRAHGTSPFAGLGASLAQAPFVMVLYRLFSSPTLNGGANALFTHTLFGVPLSDRWLAAVGSGVVPAELLVLGAVFVLLILVAWWSSRLAARSAARLAAAATEPGSGSPSSAPRRSTGRRTSPANSPRRSTGWSLGRLLGRPSSRPAGRSDAPSASAPRPGSPRRATGQPSSPSEVEALMARLGRILPFGTVVVAAFLPLAAALYLLVTTTWTAAERSVLWRDRRDGALPSVA